MILLPGVVVDTDEGCILTGKATSADAEPISPRVDDPNGSSVPILESPGGKLLNKLGVVNDIMGVFKESVLIVVVTSCEVLVIVGCSTGELSDAELGEEIGSLTLTTGGGDDGN